MWVTGRPRCSSLQALLWVIGSNLQMDGRNEEFWCGLWVFLRSIVIFLASVMDRESNSNSSTKPNWMTPGFYGLSSSHLDQIMANFRILIFKMDLWLVHFFFLIQPGFFWTHLHLKDWTEWHLDYWISHQDWNTFIRFLFSPFSALTFVQKGQICQLLAFLTCICFPVFLVCMDNKLIQV